MVYTRGYVHLIKMVTILLSIPTFYFVVTRSVAYVTGPTLYEGDRVETRDCRHCAGEGKDGPLEEGSSLPPGVCPACGGKGKVDVIVPGPNRPTRVWGVVVDAEKAEDLITFSGLSAVRALPVSAPLMPEGRAIPGGIQGALVRLEAPRGEPLEARTAESGRFTHRLLSGTIKVKATAPGREPLEEEIEIPPMTEPIWLEKAHIIDPEMPASEIQSAYGLILVIALPLKDDWGGFARVFPAVPF